MNYELVRSGASRFLRANPTASKLVGHVHMAASVEVARVQSATLVAHVALQSVGLIAVLEANLITQCPLAEPRLRAVADVHAGTVSAIVARLAL